MKQDQAEKLKKELLAYCDTRGLWVTETSVRKPHLDLISLEISIKVEKPQDGR